ncbi:MAG: apolipoprotein N-acyltransferase [Gammaproteobacteria bacterium]|nr:apolipoprotein N-acyltransferase [Gammaproteobacteria bacterium]
MTTAERSVRHVWWARAAALASGGFLPFSFAPYDVLPVAVASLAVLFFLWQDISPREAALRGYCFGLGMFGHGVWWVQVSIHQFGLPLYSFSVTMTVLFVAFMALYPALTGYLVQRLPARSPAIRLLLCMGPLWVLFEWLRGWLFTGFPWLHLGYGQTDGWLAGYAPVLGVHGVSTAVVALAAALVLAVQSTGYRRSMALLSLLLVPLAGLGLGYISWTSPQGPRAQAALVQSAVPQAVKWRSDFRARTLELYEVLSEPYWGHAVMVWPETAVPAFPSEIPDVLMRLGARADATGTALLVGMPEGEPRGARYFNSVVLLNGDRQRYAKHHLVPFGEYLPFDRVLRPLLDFLTIPMSSFSAGPERQPPLAQGALRIGVSICYEDAYASEVRKSLPDANVLVNVSDDAWFGDSIAPHQHLQISRMRALEAGRYLLRATNTGISAIIDERGGIVARSPQFEPYVLTGMFEPRSGTTPFMHFGHAPLMLGMLALVLLALRRRRD